SSRSPNTFLTFRWGARRLSAMPDAERARSVNTLNKIFALGSIALTLTVIWMVMDDSTREWKYFQRAFYQQEYRKTNDALRSIERSKDYQDQRKVLGADLQKANAELKQHQKDYEQAQKELQEADTARYKANQNYQFAKSR